MKRFLALFIVLTIFVAAAYAHDGMQHVMGTVTAITATNVTVKATSGTSQKVVLTETTRYLKGTNPISIKDIKVGDHIVIHATKKGDQLTAAEVKIGSTSGNMSGMKISGDSKTAPH